MDMKINMKEALESWRNKAVLEEDIGKHIPPSELYELLIQSQEYEWEVDRLNHLIKCPMCIQEVEDIKVCLKEAEIWDFALPKAATSETRWPKKIRLEGGKYTVIIRRNIQTKNNGLVMLQVEAGYKDALEGRTLQLLDGQDRICLEGTIIEGKISQEIEGLDAIDLKLLTVRPDEK